MLGWRPPAVGDLIRFIPTSREDWCGIDDFTDKTFYSVEAAGAAAKHDVAALHSHLLTDAHQVVDIENPLEGSRMEKQALCIRDQWGDEWWLLIKACQVVDIITLVIGKADDSDGAAPR